MPLVPTIGALRVLTTTSNFNLRYSVTGQVLALLHFLHNPYHPLQRKLSAKYTRQEHEFVLVVNTTKKSLSGKACVRNTVARRIRELALTELRVRGWSRNGGVLGPKDHRGIGILPQEQGGGKRYPLTGCLAFFPYEESIKTPIEELRKEVKMGVERFLFTHERQRIVVLERQLRQLEWEERRKTDDGRRDAGGVQSGRGAPPTGAVGVRTGGGSYGQNRAGYRNDGPRGGAYGQNRDENRNNGPRGGSYGQDRGGYRNDGPRLAGARPANPPRNTQGGMPDSRAGGFQGKRAEAPGEGSRPPPPPRLAGTWHGNSTPNTGRGESSSGGERGGSSSGGGSKPSPSPTAGFGGIKVRRL